MTPQNDLLDLDADSALGMGRKVRLSSQEEAELLSELTDNLVVNFENEQAIPDDLESSPQPVSTIQPDKSE